MLIRLFSEELQEVRVVKYQETAAKKRLTVPGCGDWGREY